jgi:1-acyl-sn-glycerol-3-phosphate acyltransferase
MGFIKALVLALGLIFFGFLAFIASIFALILTPMFPRLRFWLNPVFLVPFGIFARKIIGIKFIVLNRDKVKNIRPAVFIGNHQTGLDLALLGSVCPYGSVIVGKKQIQNIPIFGWYFKIAGNLLIDRSKTIEAKRQLEKIREILISKNINLAVFPEGTRSQQETLLPFKKGAFHMAVATGLPLVPLVCSRLKGKAIWEKFELSGGHVIVSALPPIETKNLRPEDLESFRDQVHAQMSAEFERISKLAESYDKDPVQSKKANCCT